MNVRDQSTRRPADAKKTITKVLGELDHDQRESVVSTCKNFSIESEKKFASVKVAAGRGRNHLKGRPRKKADIWDAGGGGKCLARPGRPRDEHHVWHGHGRLSKGDSTK